MNNYAKNKLNLKNTNFANVHGLSNSESYSTSEDLLIVINAVLEYKTIREIISSHSYTARLYH